MQTIRAFNKHSQREDAIEMWALAACVALAMQAMQPAPWLVSTTSLLMTLILCSLQNFFATTAFPCHFKFFFAGAYMVVCAHCNFCCCCCTCSEILNTAHSVNVKHKNFKWQHRQAETFSNGVFESLSWTLTGAFHSSSVSTTSVFPRATAKWSGVLQKRHSANKI